MVGTTGRVQKQFPSILYFCACLRASSGKLKNKKKLKTFNYFLKTMFPRVDVIGGLVVYLAGLGSWVLADWILGF
jgi:hypothetical protein